MPGAPLRLHNAIGVLCIAGASVVAHRLPGDCGGLLRFLAVFALAAGLAGARRRLTGRGTAYIDDLVFDLAVYLGIGLFATACSNIAARCIGAAVGPGWPAALVYLIGPTDRHVKRFWGVGS